MGNGGDRFQDIQSELDLILWEGSPIDEAAPRVLRVLCEGLGWDVGIVWGFDESSHALRFVASWHHPSGTKSQLEKLSERSTLTPGVGLPGRILAAGEPTWIMDVQRDRSFPRSPAAIEDGIHGAFGFPLLDGWNVVGIIELFSKETKERDDELLVSVARMGPKLGGLLVGESE